MIYDTLLMVLKLGIRAKRLTKAIGFEQADGLLIGGVPATHLTKPVCLEIGEHWEMIRLVIVSKMTESVILGLSWMDNWLPLIWWEGGERRLKLGRGPIPPPQEHTRWALWKEAVGRKSEHLRASTEQSSGTHLIPKEY